MVRLKLEASLEIVAASGRAQFDQSGGVSPISPTEKSASRYGGAISMVPQKGKVHCGPAGVRRQQNHVLK
jgi:hypothetical protein